MEISAEFGFNRGNAEKIYEYQIMQGQQVAMNTAVAAFAAYKAGPFQVSAAKYYVLFRKSWMQVPIRMLAAGCGYYVTNQLQTRLFPKLHRNYWHDRGQ